MLHQRSLSSTSARRTAALPAVSSWMMADSILYKKHLHRYNLIEWDDLNRRKPLCYKVSEKNRIFIPLIQNKLTDRQGGGLSTLFLFFCHLT